MTLGGSTDAETEATLYEQAIKAKIPTNKDGIAEFDLMLIGVGLDGHVGSLYPDSEAVADNSGRSVLSVVKPSSSSITLSLSTMLAAKEIIIASAGKSDKYPLGKAEGMLRALEKEDESIDSFPAVAFRGKAKWLLDEGAASMLKGL